jgi:hypothetical protein
VPGLFTEYPLKLASPSFWHILIILWALLFFQSCIFSTSALEIIFLSTELWFLSKLGCEYKLYSELWVSVAVGIEKYFVSSHHYSQFHLSATEVIWFFLRLCVILCSLLAYQFPVTSIGPTHSSPTIRTPSFLSLGSNTLPWVVLSEGAFLTCLVAFRATKCHLLTQPRLHWPMWANIDLLLQGLPLYLVLIPTVCAGLLKTLLHPD